MQFMLDWILSTAAEVGFRGEVREALEGVTIDIAPVAPVDNEGSVAQVFLPYLNKEGIIFLRKLIDSEIPKVIPVNWYEVGLAVEDGALIIQTYDGGGLFARGQRPKDQHFKIIITSKGCHASGLWPQKVDEEVIAVEDIQQIVPTDITSTVAFEVFISATLMSELGKKHRQLCVRSVAERFPEYVPISLDNVSSFNPDLSFEKISGCDAFIFVVTDFITTWMENEYKAAKKARKPILLLVKDELLSDRFHTSQLAGLGPDAVTSYREENLGELVSRWLERIKTTVSAKRALGNAPRGYEVNSLRCPEVIDLGLTEKEWVRVALGQIDYKISEQKPFALIDKKETEERVANVIRIGRDCKADFIIFPELSGTGHIVQADADEANGHNSGVFITGSSYQDGWNIANLMIGGSSYLIRKRHRSKFEDSPIAEHVMKEARPLRIFQTKFGAFSVLICEDFRHDGRLVAPLVDLLLVTSYNPAPDNFRARASVLVEDYHCYVLIVNASKFGNTAVYAVIDRQYHKDLEEADYRDPSGPPCEIARIPQGKQGVLVADLCLKRTAVAVPTPVLENYANVRNVRVLGVD